MLVERVLGDPGNDPSLTTHIEHVHAILAIDIDGWFDIKEWNEIKTFYCFF